jgi:hypothetical protein
MREASSRRYTRLLNEAAELPDLVMVDGGVAQANAVREVLDLLELDLPVVGLASGMRAVAPPRLRPHRPGAFRSRPPPPPARARRNPPLATASTSACDPPPSPWSGWSPWKAWVRRAPRPSCRLRFGESPHGRRTRRRRREGQGPLPVAERLLSELRSPDPEKPTAPSGLL